ncbi:guanylate cyclase [Chloropicon primus]|uniref:Guanylate cyclase n=2 Tax=Chloropicon primus TaxID=1764295 RepID=A0A5B8MNS6_9CHLO|nr:guanylate cyclase [Chloropicon primus]UPR00439.1 guanylate cyclase [Chloropicon primus]|eukprot:QDZ21225.1 guanylate cyclase [Chloropicon primus]
MEMEDEGRKKKDKEGPGPSSEGLVGMSSGVRSSGSKLSGSKSSARYNNTSSLSNTSSVWLSKRSEDQSMRFSQSLTMHPLLQGSGVTGQGSLSSGHSGPGDADITRIYRGDPLMDTPLENKIFWEHTTCLGLRFRPFGIERIFLNGRARQRKGVVYLGYVLVLLISLLELLKVYLLQRYRGLECPTDYRDGYCEDVTRLLFTGTYEYYFRYTFPAYVVFTVLGCGSHYIIHRSDAIPDKAWAMLCTFSLYFIFTFASYVVSIVTDHVHWPDHFLLTALEMLTIYVFFSGTPSFSTFVILWIQAMLVYFVAFPIKYDELNVDKVNGNIEAVQLKVNFMESTYPLVMSTFILLVGAWMNELMRRKQFLQRVIMVDQQDEIIEQKIKNTELQKALLENILPSSIVSKLGEQDFAMKSWDQLRKLSQRHFGVCILFAELEGFTAFSAQVNASKVMEYLNDVFQVFDGLLDDYDVYKVETVGDQYVAAVGVVTGKMLNRNVSKDTDDGGDVSGCGSVTFQNPVGNGNGSKEENDGGGDDGGCNIELTSSFNTGKMISFAKAIMKGSRCVEAPAADVKPVLRIGLHTGPCMSGIVGTKNFRFCLFGDAMNTSARMVQTGPANCIHTTKDVADLTPEEPWEKLKLIDVKGKGSMQTYLLRLEGQADVDAISNSVRSYENPLLQHTDSKRSEQSEESYTFKLLRDNSRVVPGHNKYEDILPVKESIFKAKTTLFGLWFKSLEWEQAYLDGEARMVETEVYIGYLLYILVLLTNVLYGYINYRVLNEICTSELSAYREYCLLKFGRNALDLAVSDPAGRQVTYAELMNFAVIQLSPVSLGVLISLNCVGPILHYWIHRSSYVKKKSWALLTVFVVYTLKLVVIMYMMYDGDVKSSTGENMDAEWPSSWGPMITTQALLLVFFSGVPMKLYLLWWIIACALYFGLTLPILLKEGALLSQGDYSVVITNNEYIKVTLLVFIYAIILNAGKYFKDVSNRKRFLQRVSVLKSQDQIIREKSKNENLQRQFLGNILPPHLVEELEIDKCSPLASIERLRTLTETHMGVSILYADLVGFTWFSAQVDPFKVMVFLNNVFQVFDGLCDEYGVQKVETVGDCYVASVGVLTGELVNFKSPTFSETARALFSLQGSSSFYKSSSIHQSVAHDVTGKFTDHSSLRTTASTNAKSLLDFAKAMILGSRRIKKPTLRTPATMRIGIHAGSCMSGIIGTKNLKYSLVGEDVVTAATMEHEGKPDAIHASDEIAFLLPDEDWKKFKLLKDSYGEDMQTYLLEV